MFLRSKGVKQSLCKKSSNPFLEPTSTKQRGKFLAHGNNWSIWWGFELTTDRL